MTRKEALEAFHSKVLVRATKEVTVKASETETFTIEAGSKAEVQRFSNDGDFYFVFDGEAHGWCSPDSFEVDPVDVFRAALEGIVDAVGQATLAENFGGKTKAKKAVRDFKRHSLKLFQMQFEGTYGKQGCKLVFEAIAEELLA